MLSQWQKHSRWRMYLTLLISLVLICHCEMAPTDIPELSSSAKRKSQEIGSLGDFTWQAWLLVDTQSGLQAGLDSSTHLRKITPKSIFIAPDVLPACSDGYLVDEMGRCIKSVNINTNAHYNFLLQRLRDRFKPDDSSKTPKVPTGPLQLNIPLLPQSKPQSTKIELEDTFSMNDPIIAPIEDEIHLNRKKVKPHEPLESVYNIKNDTASNEDRPMFSPGNSSASDISKDDRKSDTVVPVAEFIDEETNGNNFSEVVDYRIPLASKTLLNTSSVRNLNVSNIENNVSITEKQENTTEMSPALTTLLSSTKFSDSNPDIDFNTETDDLSFTTQSDIDDFVTVKALNLTSNLTTKEIIDVNVDPTFAPLKKLSEDSSIELDEHLDNDTRIQIGSEQDSLKFNESDSQETDILYDDEVEDEDYLYSTDAPDEEDSIENDEILKHGEAGITIPTRNIEYHDQQQQQLQQPQTNQTESQNKTIFTDDQVLIRFNDSMPTDKDETGSSISSEVSIDGDLILETTILDVNTKELQTTTIKSPDITYAIEHSNEDDIKKLFEIDKSHSPQPKIVLSSQNSHDTISTTLHGYKQTEQQMKLETRTGDQKNEKHEAVSSTSELVTYNPPVVDPITETLVINEELNTKENVMKKNSKNSDSSETVQSGVPQSNFKRTSINSGPAEDYVRFPNYMIPAQSYVRFPSNEANSIHSQTYKQSPVNNAAYDSNNIKSNIRVHQKPWHYMAALDWRNQQQADHVLSVMSQKQKQSKPLLPFWSKMPLVKDPSIYPSNQSPDNKQIQEQSRNRLSHTSSSRKRDFYSEISSEDTDRMLIQDSKLPIDG